LFIPSSPLTTSLGTACTTRTHIPRSFLVGDRGKGHVRSYSDDSNRAHFFSSSCHAYFHPRLPEFHSIPPNPTIYVYFISLNIV
jgi:hypothetical protein